jgi:GNAT superfamily N-acetyltransferase
MAAEPRRAQHSDEPAVQALVVEAFEGYIPIIGRTPLPMLADHAYLIANHDTWVLDDSTGVYAMLEMMLKPDSLYIDTVAVSKRRQGQGISKLLLGFAEQRAQALGRTAITLFTNEHYTHLLAMYARRGYSETHREPYLGSDIVHFRKELAANTPEVR